MPGKFNYTKAPPSYDVIIAIDGFATKYPDLDRVFRPMATMFDGSNLLAVDIHHRNRADSALLILHIDMRCVTGPLIRNLKQTCEGAGFQCVQVNEIHKQNRQSFYQKILKQYEVSLPGLPTPIEAVRVLAEKLGLVDGKQTAAPDPASMRAPDVQVRFLRGTEWHRGRICRLSDSGIYVATASMPRQGDIVETELRFSGRKINVPAQVVQVTSMRQAESLGTVGFGARLLPGNKGDRLELSRMVQLAGGGQIVHPASPRREPRFNLRWPGWLEAKGRRRRVTLLDVSNRGAFLGGPVDLVRDSQVRLIVPVDDRNNPVEANARVIRAVSPAHNEADNPTGLGIELVHARPEDVYSYQQFVAGVARRVERQVLVGCDKGKMPELIEQLSAAGYYCVAASEPREVYAMAIAKAAPDLVVIDSSLNRRQEQAVHALKYRLRQNRIQVIDIAHGADPQVRHLVDLALGF